jgi:hypothetical protein
MTDALEGLHSWTHLVFSFFSLSLSVRALSRYSFRIYTILYTPDERI